LPLAVERGHWRCPHPNRWRDGRAEAVAPMDAECATAPWESGYANYMFLPDGRIAVTIQQGPVHELVLVSADDVVKLLVPYTSIRPFLAAGDDRVALIGASPTRIQEIALVSTDGSGQVEVIRRGPVRANQVRRPVLLIHGVRDEVAPIDDVTTLADGLRDGGLLVGMLALDGVGHYVTGSALAMAVNAELDAYRGMVMNASAQG